MYESFFGFTRRPFAAIPQAHFYFPATAIETAKKTLSRCIDRSEGPALVIGQAGTGKTLLCHLLREHFRERFQLCHLANSRLCSRRALLQAVLFELKLEYRELEEGELRLSLIDFISSSDLAKEGLLLLVDEAHSIPNPLLEEMRMITNLVRNGESRVRLVLVGLPQLEERFASPKLESFSQRIAARCYLDTLTRAETTQYIRFQLTRAGAKSDGVIDEDAMRVVHATTDGVPRLVNQLCDHALVMAAVGGCSRLDSGVIQKAWTDLQQLPAPNFGTETSPSEKPGENFIEFGSLDDAGQSPATAVVRTSEQESAPSLTVDDVASSTDGDVAEAVAARHGLDSTDETYESHLMYDPTDASEPDVRQIPSSDDPFAETFQEEEVVIDRFVSLRMQEDHGPQVASREGREIAERVPETHRSMSLFTGAVDETGQVADEAFRLDAVTERVTQQLDQAEDLAGDRAGRFVEPADMVPYPLRSDADVSDVSHVTDPSNIVSGGEFSGGDATNVSPANRPDHTLDAWRSHPANEVQIEPFGESVESSDNGVDLYVVDDLRDEVRAESNRHARDEGVDIVHPITDDVIVVETDNEMEQAAPAAGQTGRVKRLEYGQLFAKLRGE